MSNETLVAEYLAACGAGDYAEADRMAAQLDMPELVSAARLARPEALAAAAAWYASQGIPVFPCVAGGKKPLTMRGFHDASVDGPTVAAWWRKWPEANIGSPTGLTFDVIDVDGRDGHASLWSLVKRGKVPPVTGRASTPHGVHLYIDPQGLGCTTGASPGIDYRGTGGYVILPPSRLSTGHGYRWLLPLPALGGA